MKKLKYPIERGIFAGFEGCQGCNVRPNAVIGGTGGIKDYEERLSAIFPAFNR